MAPDYAGKIRFAKANVSDSPDTTAEFMVMGLPTLVVLKDGDTVQSVTGGQNRRKVEKLIAMVS